MISLLSCLQPRFEKKRTVLYDELDEFIEIIFVQKGEIVICYEINKIRKYCIRYKDKCVVGGYGATFNQRSAFIYTTLTDIHGLSITKQNWNELLEENEDVAASMRGNLLMDYITKIRCKVLVNKKAAIRRMEERKDHQMILASQFKADVNLGNLVRKNLMGNDDSDDEINEVDLMTSINKGLEQYENLVNQAFEQVDTRDQSLLEQSEEAIRLNEMLNVKIEDN